MKISACQGTKYIEFQFYGTKNTRWSDRGSWRKSEFQTPPLRVSRKPLFDCISKRNALCKRATVFLFKTKIIKHLKWANKWPRKPNVCFSFILSRINLCYCCRKPVPRSQSSSWTTDVFYSSSLIASGHLFVCAGGGKDTRVSNMIMWLFGVSAITTQLNTQSLTG